MQLPDVILELQEGGQVALLAHPTNELGPRLSGQRRLLHRPEANVADEAAVVEEAALAEVAVQDLGRVVVAEVVEQLVVVVFEGLAAEGAAVVEVRAGLPVPEDVLVPSGVCKEETNGLNF